MGDVIPIRFNRDSAASGAEVRSFRKSLGGAKHEITAGEGVKFSEMKWRERKAVAENLKKETGQDISWKGREGRETFKKMQESIEHAEKYGKEEIHIPSRSEDIPESGSAADGFDDREAA